MNLKVRQLREVRKPTQQERGKAIGICFRSIQSWGRGDSYPNADMAWRPCELLCADSNEFMGWSDEHPQESPFILMLDESALLSGYCGCTLGRRQKAVNAVWGQRQLFQGLVSADVPSETEEGAA